MHFKIHKNHQNQINKTEQKQKKRTKKKKNINPSKPKQQLTKATLGSKFTQKGPKSSKNLVNEAVEGALKLYALLLRLD